MNGKIRKPKSPPKWFKEILDRNETWFTQNDIADDYNLSKDTVRIAFKRYGIEGETFRNERNLIQLRYRLIEVKSKITSVFRSYDSL